MKRLAVVIAVLSYCAQSAAASPELAEAWGEKAAELYQTALALREGAEQTAGFEAEIARFSVTASRLAGWIDDENGPADLGCIFRGMAAEAESQLEALDAGKTEDALERLTPMFSDAELVSAAAIQAVGRDTVDNGAEAGAGTCHARPMARRQYFTEQP